MASEGELAERVHTGVPGLDVIMEGGFLQGGVYIVQGPPGAGKTILGNQIGFAHAAQGRQVAYVTLLAESHTRMIAHLRRMAFFDSGAVGDRLYYLSGFKVLEADGLDGLIRLLRGVMESRGAVLLVLDGLVSAGEAAPSARAFKRFIHELQAVTSMAGCTTLLLSSCDAGRQLRPEHTMVDGIIELSDQLRGLRMMRHIEVRKLRGTAQIGGQHTLQISDAGISVQPRLEVQTLLQPVRPVVAQQGHRAPFGVKRLDEMLHGGIPCHSVTMLLGPSGSGKTILGLQFLAQGASEGEPGVYFSFYERPDALLRKGQRIGMDLSGPLERGLIALVHHSAVEAVVDLLGESLLREIRRLKARRLVIDGLQGFQLAAEYPERIRDVFSALGEELDREGVTTVYTMETQDLFGPRIEVPIGGISAMTHNVMLLRHVELRSQLYRLISIIKLRDSDYDPAIREFRIEDRGIVVADTFKTAEAILGGTAHAAPRRKTEPRARARKSDARPRRSRKR
jgi:circadian clock protein KaiC